MAEHSQRECPKHGITRFYRTPSSRGFKCSKCNSEGVSNRRRRAIIQLKTEFGSRCKSCGYSSCLEALEFHHLDPSFKEHKLSDGITKSIARMREEASKCVLLCANCHREVHSGYRFL